MDLKKYLKKGTDIAKDISNVAKDEFEKRKSDYDEQKKKREEKERKDAEEQENLRLEQIQSEKNNLERARQRLEDQKKLMDVDEYRETYPNICAVIFDDISLEISETIREYAQRYMDKYQTPIVSYSKVRKENSNRILLDRLHIWIYE